MEKLLVGDDDFHAQLIVGEALKFIIRTVGLVVN